ncbi:MAG: preprotein translocase subunit YajC [Syntrophomonadaceae bacterium]
MGTQTWLPTAIYLGVFLAIFYVLIIMPRRKQEKKHKETVASLKRGDKVVTIGGLKGEVAKVKEETLVLKVNDNTEMEFLKRAVAYKEDEK